MGWEQHLDPANTGPAPTGKALPLPILTKGLLLAKPRAGARSEEGHLGKGQKATVLSKLHGMASVPSGIPSMWEEKSPG